MQARKPRVLILASGGKNPDEGGSGARECYEYSLVGHQGISYEVVGVVSNRERGGVWNKINRVGGGHLFECHPGPYDKVFYMNLVEKYQPDVIMLSGWIKIVVGPVLNLRKVKIINIHPGLLPFTAGLYGHSVHGLVRCAFSKGATEYTECVMHFVGEIVDDDRLVFFRHRVRLRKGERAESIAKRVNEKERAWQAYVLGLVANGLIWLNDSQEVCFHNDFLREMLLPE